MSSTNIPDTREVVAPHLPREGNGSRILVIEDDNDLRALIAEVLRDDGFDVLEAENGRVGIDLAGVCRPALILCDVRMPEFDGYSVLNEVRRMPGTAQVPFVLLSGVGVTTQDVRHGMNLGADDYLTKPFTPDVLRETVYARLRRHALDEVGAGVAQLTTLPSGPSQATAGLTTLDGRFHLLRRATSGGMATIYEATDLTDQSRVAVKIAPFRDEMRSARLEREAVALAKLDSAYIVPFRYVGRTVEGSIYMVMNWLEGRDLQHELAQVLLSLRDTLTVGVRIAAGLVDAHAHGILHRDVKPSNIFLIGARPENAVLIDFGLASVPDATPLTQSGAVLGTLGYIAPEQVLHHEVSDPRSDLFSLGCVLFQCLTGKVPFAAHDAIASVASVLIDDAPHLRELSPEMPEALDALLFQLMLRSPEQRPRDAAEVLARLRQISANL